MCTALHGKLALEFGHFMLHALQEVSKVSNIHAFMESQKRHFREDNTTHPQEFRVSTILTKIQRWGKWGRERETSEKDERIN